MTDPVVRATQEWLNSTYGQASWFEAIPPDRLGRTGWTTMFALTRALQFELGIDVSLISDSFGPTTMEQFTVNVGVVSAATKPNVIKILQGALWCKGYAGGQLSGTYSPQTQVGVSESLQDMGFTSRLEVDARVMKALLTMDAYVVVRGGSPDIRTVQQWMNRTYRDFVNYAIIPCDGHYSRNVQKMLVYAIQWALNVSGANGNYGPGTRNSVRTNGAVQQGNSGRLVQLFIASLYFNRYNPGGFGDSFTAAVAAAVRTMQTFEKLPVNGRGDYATWSSLLVSNGDPLRAVTGVDTRFWITPEIASDLKSNGFAAVGRYLANSKVANPLDKKLRPGEFETIINAGLALFPIWQMSGTSADHFSGSQAILDADEATTAAEGYRIPHGSIIYFAVDFDAIDQDIDSNILPYFHALTSKMRQKGSPYLVGVYGSRNVCTRVSREAGAVSSFVSGMSTGFSGNLGFTLPQNWAFNQINETNLVLNSKNYYQNGTVVAVDNNVVSGRDPGVRTLTRASINDGFCDYLDLIYACAVDYHDTIAPGGHPPNLLTLQWLRHLNPDYTTARWEGIANVLDEAFLEYCSARTAAPILNYFDVAHGIALECAHMGATANAQLARGIPSDKATCNRADIGGWAGDLLTTYRDYTEHGRPSGTDLGSFARAWIFGSQGRFTLNDGLEDMDGFWVGLVAAEPKSVAASIRDLLNAKTAASPFHQFHTLRFGGADQVLEQAVMYLFTTPDLIIGTAREQLAGVGIMPPGEAEIMADAFRTVLGEHRA